MQKISLSQEAKDHYSINDRFHTIMLPFSFNYSNKTFLYVLLFPFHHEPSVPKRFPSGSFFFSPFSQSQYGLITCQSNSKKVRRGHWFITYSVLKKKKSSFLFLLCSCVLEVDVYRIILSLVPRSLFHPVIHSSLLISVNVLQGKKTGYIC